MPRITTTAGARPALDDVLALVAERADAMERERRLTDDVVAAVRATGLHRMFVPAALGGAEAPVVEVVDIIERLAAVDGSTAWCSVIAGGSNVFAGYLPEAAARVVFADPDQGSATMFAPAGRLAPDDGRMRLTGRWPFASNCLHSTWIGLGALVHRPDGEADPVPRVCFVPLADVTVEDTWDALGLRATGSHHVSVSGLPFDLDRSCTFADRPWPEGTLWRLPLYTALLPTLAAVPLGIARGALDEIARQAREGRSARRGQVGDDPVALAALADADARLQAARAGLRTVVDDAHALAERGEPVGRILQARAILACHHACDVGVEVTAAAHALGGGAAAYTASPLARAVRDVHTARQHLLFSPKHRPELAKIVAGTDTTYPPFVT
jgi:alkylation response protein AidB-like acyl-CoA dehydrogenase